MAKKTSKSVEEIEGITPEATEGAEATPKAPKAPKTTKIITFTLGREPEATDKLCSQCSVVYQHIANHCNLNGKCERKALVAGITVEELKTRQGVDRIVAYYLPALIKSGLIVKHVEEAPKDEVPAE